MAKEGAKYGVRSNVICPGFVRTPLVDKQIPEQARELGITEERVIKEIMLGETVDKQFTTVDDIAEVALLLAAFKTNALTGQSIIVSHGVVFHRLLSEHAGVRFSTLSSRAGFGYTGRSRLRVDGHRRASKETARAWLSGADGV